MIELAGNPRGDRAEKISMFSLGSLSMWRSVAGALLKSRILT